MPAVIFRAKLELVERDVRARPFRWCCAGSGLAWGCWYTWYGFLSPTAALCGSAVYRRSRGPGGGFGKRLEGGGREVGAKGRRCSDGSMDATR